MITVYVGKCLLRGISRAITVQGKMKTRKKNENKKKIFYAHYFPGEFLGKGEGGNLYSGGKIGIYSFIRHLRHT